jgi:hypothetical protein
MPTYGISDGNHTEVTVHGELNLNWHTQTKKNENISKPVKYPVWKLCYDTNSGNKEKK